MCLHELWSTSVSHPISALNNSLKYNDITRKVLSRFLDLFFKGLLFRDAFFVFCAILLFFLLSSDWVVIVVCGFISDQGIS